MIIPNEGGGSFHRSTLDADTRTSPPLAINHFQNRGGGDVLMCDDKEYIVIFTIGTSNLVGRTEDEQDHEDKATTL